MLSKKIRKTRSRQFAGQENDHFPEISESLEKRLFSPEFKLENGIHFRDLSNLPIPLPVFCLAA